ncbi:hypothetical protein PC128_g166 [Phytophthora cactorum]|nr:hypothetical protein PC128_g166 [Phytophthora cactorum]
MKEHFDEQSWDFPKASPFFDVLREHKDVLPDEIPAELPQDKGIQHEIDLVPGTKYCVTRQWPLPPDQVKAIDDFFGSRRQAGQVRESKSPHSAPTFCVKKPQGGWRIVHAYNKLNDATIPAQTPIPRKDLIIDSMARSTIYSALDLRDGFYQILMRERDITLTAVSTPSAMLWEWLVMPHGLKSAPATFNRCVAHLLRSVRDSKLYANLKRRIFGRARCPFLELRQFHGLATYLCKYIENYAGKLRPLSQRLKKEAEWKWAAELADQDRPFHVVCDASDFAIACALMQHEHEGRDRVVHYRSRQLKPAGRNYPVHEKELLVMKYALAKFRVRRTSRNGWRDGCRSSQSTTSGLSTNPEKRLNVVADALSRRPDYAVKTADANRIGVERVSAPSSSLIDDVKAAYASDADAKQLLSYASAPSDEARRKLASHVRARAHRYRVHEGLLLYNAVDDDVIRICAERL